MSDVFPLSVALTLHVPASGKERTHEPPAAVPFTVFEPFVAVTAAPLVTDTTRESSTPGLLTAFVLPIIFNSPP